MPGKVRYKGEINFRLAKAIEKHFGSSAKMCREWPGLKSKQNDVSALVHLKMWPWNEDHRDAENFGKFKTVCALLAEALNIFPEKLFPIKLYIGLVPKWKQTYVGRKLKSHVSVPNGRLDKMTAPEVADFMANANELKRRIKAVAMTLSHREREILKLRYGLGDGYSYTLDEVGHIFKVTRDRIRQIEFKAVRKLQQPHRSQRLEGFLD